MTEPTKYPWRDENGDCTNCGGHTGIQPECECFLTYARSEIAALTAQVEALDAERRRDALDGQNALDEANNRIIELTKERDVCGPY